MAAKRGNRGLTHLDSKRQPSMVDIGDKAVTEREAEAEAVVLLPPGVAAALRGTGHRTSKGPVFDTAIIAGVMAVKNTAFVIPFCHPLPIDHCEIRIESDGANRLRVRCRVRTLHKTGVEMEALTGATVAALTVYDMCKALSHRIRIASVRLLRKSGGKRDIRPRAAAKRRRT